MKVEQSEEFKGLYKSKRKYEAKDLLLKWYDEAVENMRKKHDKIAYNKAIETFNMLLSINPNFKNCKENVQQCNQNIEDTNKYIIKCEEEDRARKKAKQEEDSAKKKAEQEAEEKRRLEQEKRREEQKRKEWLKRIGKISIAVAVVVVILITILVVNNNQREYANNHQATDIAISIVSKSTSFQHNTYSYDENAGTYFVYFNCNINNRSSAVVDYVKVEISVKTSNGIEKGTLTSEFGNHVYDNQKLSLNSKSSIEKQTQLEEYSSDGNVGLLFAYLYNTNLSEMRLSYKITNVNWSDGAKYIA